MSRYISPKSCWGEHTGMIVQGRGTATMFLGLFVRVWALSASLQCQDITQDREPDELATVKRPFGITVFMCPEVKVKVGISS